jgi:glutamate/aspartate transport system substrate-binding protein
MRATVGLVLLALTLAGPAYGQDLQGTLRKVKETGSLVLGYRESAPPFSFVGSDGQPIGYSVDICLQVVGSIRQTLGLPGLTVSWVPVTAADRVDAVANGRIDLECGSTSITLSRQERVDFSQMIWLDGGSLLARAGAGVSRLGDLGGKRVAVVPGTTTENALREGLRRRGVRAEVVAVKDHDEGRTAVEAGRVDAYASDRAMLVGLLLTAAGREKLMMTDEQFSFEPYGLMLRRGDAPFRLAVNRTLANLSRSDEIARIYEKWFGRIGRPTGVLVVMYLLNALPE